MSTRAQICIKRDTEGFKETGGIYIYKHSDGYPEGVLPTLEPMVKDFITNRGNDATYLLCQIVREFAVTHPRRSPEKYYGQPYTGWGLDTVEHGDIEFLYEVDPRDGTIYINGERYAE